MSRYTKLARCLDGISQRSIQFIELEKAHHFLFALPMDDVSIEDEIDFIVMGVNPGETAGCRKIDPSTGLEESFREDYQKSASKKTSGRQRWFKHTSKILPESKVVFTELFFWSSNNRAE